MEQKEGKQANNLKSEHRPENRQPGEGIGLPELVWDIGTAYDFFISLSVLHNPEGFGLRASWAAGVRSRLSAEHRKTLLEAERLGGTPLHWVYYLPAPKSADTVLYELNKIPAAERLPSLMISDEETPPAIKDIYLESAASGTWNEEQVAALREEMRKYSWKKHKIPNTKVLGGMLQTWANAEDFGERYLAALEAYQRNFFSEEEKRIAPILQEQLDKAKELSIKAALPDLMEQLSHGLHFETYMDREQIILAPSYWGAPLVFFQPVSDTKMIFTFGARPADTSLVPGELVPDALLLGLKAISDPTRLRILRFLSCNPMTPAELARKLRLRAPTVTHHLRTLRLAGLVHLSLDINTEGHYAARLEAIDELNSILKKFLECE